MLRKFIAFALLLVIAISCTKEVVVDYSATDKKIIEDFLAVHHLTAQSTASGLYYIIKKPGGANHPNVNNQILVNYQGFLTDSNLFDTSYKLGKPAIFALNNVIAGWKEGLPMIGTGGEIQLFIPSALGYGSIAKTSNYAPIPANSVLLFDIGLVDYY
jgi:FKBP-type peptidyl-prolyl cis-trans isomerase